MRAAQTVATSASDALIAAIRSYQPGDTVKVTVSDPSHELGICHCGMCHTAINALGGSSESQAFEGGLIAPGINLSLQALHEAAKVHVASVRAFMVDVMPARQFASLGDAMRRVGEAVEASER